MGRFIFKARNLLKHHLQIVLYSYFWLGLFVCGLGAPEHRVEELQSNVITKGWHLSLLSLVLILPVPIIYYVRIRRGTGKANGSNGAVKANTRWHLTL